MTSYANPQEDTNALRVVLASGSVALPSVVFANDPTVGLYWDVNGVHLTGLATPVNAGDATNKAYVDSAAPTLIAGSNITLTPSGSTLTIAASGGGSSFPLLAPNGSADAPSYSFTDHPTTGIYGTGSDSILFAAVGVLVADINNSGLTIFGAGTQISVDDGVAAAPAYTFSSNSGTGIYNDSGGNSVNFTVSGTDVGSFNSGGLNLNSTHSTGAATATWTNSPVAGNPTTYVQIQIAGVPYWIAAWAV